MIIAAMKFACLYIGYSPAAAMATCSVHAPPPHPPEPPTSPVYSFRTPPPPPLPSTLTTASAGRPSRRGGKVSTWKNNLHSYFYRISKIAANDRLKFFFPATKFVTFCIILSSYRCDWGFICKRVTVLKKVLYFNEIVVW